MYGRLDRLERLQRGESLDDLPADGPTGWYEFRPQKFAPGAEALWYWTLDRSALELTGRDAALGALPRRPGARLPGGGAARGAREPPRKGRGHAS